MRYLVVFCGIRKVLAHKHKSFLKNRSEVLEPLHQLLRNDRVWRWSANQDRAFKAAKQLLKKDVLLAHFDERLPIILTCDASSYGAGAVLSHVLRNGTESPIAYYSRTLTKAERNYSQTDREGLSIIAAVKKFNQYLQGRKFKIITDHKPLLGLFNPERPLPQMISPRVLRWSLLLSSYDYKLEYRRGKDIGNADALSRLPLYAEEGNELAPADILLLENVPVTQLNARLIAEATRKDPVLARISLMVLNGWPSRSAEEKFKPYFSRKDALSVHQNCVLWGSRVIIPAVLQEEVLSLLHQGHPGIVRMKGLARSYVWWPNMDSSIENTVKSCCLCQENQKSPSKAPIHPWEWAERPWSRLHVDFAGPYKGQTFFILVDSHSKWLEVVHVSSMSAATTIDHLRSIFATHGLPNSVVSDNGPTFKSAEFQQFLELNQIRQILVAPYHPSSNGQAERMVATTKQALKRVIQGNWKVRLARFLFSQHVLPCTTTGKSPAELLMNRRLTSLLDRLHPDLNKEMKSKQDKQVELQVNKRLRIFGDEDPVYIRNYTGGAPWTPARIVEATGPVSYRAQCLESGEVSRRHIDQIRQRVPSESLNRPSDTSPTMEDVEPPDGSVKKQLLMKDTASDSTLPSPDSQVLRRSGRERSTPKYLEDYMIHS